MKRIDSKAFTLVELLAVIAVISILIVITAGAVRSSTDRQLVNAGNLVVDLATTASSIAKGKNALTALVIVTDAEQAADSLRLLTILERRIGEPWRQISKWERLPEGIVIDPSEDKSSFFASLSELPDPAPGEVKGATAYAFQIFLPDGRMLTPSNPSLFLKAAIAGETPSNYYQITFNHNTGVPMIRRP